MTAETIATASAAATVYGYLGMRAIRGFLRIIAGIVQPRGKR